MKNGLPEDLDELQKMLNGAYRKGNQIALASLVLNLLLLALVVFQLQGKPTPYDPQKVLDQIKALTPR